MIDWATRSRCSVAPSEGRSVNWLSGVHGQFNLYLWFDAQVFGNAFNNEAEISRSGVAIAIKHPMEGFFAQAGLTRQFLKTNVRVDDVAKDGKSNSSFTL